MPPIAGHLVNERLDYDGARGVTAYVPPGVPEAIVFAGDGQLITSWAGDLEASEAPPTMIIGTHRLDDETLRIQEYSPGESTAAFAFDPERFAAHEKFFVEDVRRWVRSRFDVALPPTEPLCLVCQRAQSSRSPWGSGIPTSTARSCARRRARASDRPP